MDQLTLLITNQSSGPARVIDRVCVCVLELDDL